MTVAENIARFIYEKSITTTFGIVGAGNLALFDAITRLGETQIVCCHHEQAAVMSATFHARISGRPGIALLTTGAGSANAITGVLAAQMDSVALVVISGNEPSRYLDAPECRVVGVQGYRTARVAQHVCKAAYTARFFEILEIAYDECQAGRPGPVWVDFPRDIFNART